MNVFITDFLSHLIMLIDFFKLLIFVLIRYERMPSSLDTVVFPDGTQPALGAYYGSNTLTAGSGSLLTTLSRYLHHRRWVWAAQSSPHFPLAQESIARILATLTK